MAIRQGFEQDLERLVNLYKTFFTVHNQFQQPAAEVVAYLQEQLKTNPLLVSETKGVYDGALFLVRIGQSSDETHKIWKFRHFAYLSEDIGAKLLKAAEDDVQKLSDTVKIELTIAATEPGLDFYLNHSYVKEGRLKDHYRAGELCYILGKSFV
ncbi:MAG TPA: hypothetical protein VJH37_01360 [Candidatus Nanoarchaeia archaeon]|nr:hypothetical protein [Candidatus Nanoarchaeia archaeon]